MTLSLTLSLALFRPVLQCDRWWLANQLVGCGAGLFAKHTEQRAQKLCDAVQPLEGRGKDHNHC